MAEEKISEEFRLKNINEPRNYFTEEINQKELISKKHKKVNSALHYIEHLLILASAVTYRLHFCFCFCSGIPI